MSNPAAYRFRIYPTPDQEKLIDKSIRATRWVYNWYLGQKFTAMLLYRYNKINNTIDTSESSINEFLLKSINYEFASIKRKNKNKSIDDCLDLAFSPLQILLKDLYRAPDEDTRSSILVKFCKEFDFTSDGSDGEKQLSAKLTRIKKLKKYGWLNEVSAQALNGSLRNAAGAFTRWLKKQAKKPKYKPFRNYGSFPNQNDVERSQNIITIKSGEIGRLKIRKFASIKIVVHRPIVGLIGTVTIRKEPSGAYYASFPVERDVVIPSSRIITKGTSSGIDLGITSLVTTSSGEKYRLPIDEIKKVEERISVLQRRLQKQRDKNKRWKYSKRYKHSLQRINKLRESITNLKEDFVHKLTHLLTQGDVTLIGVEDLSIQNMLQNRKLSRAISRMGWYKFICILEYKAKSQGITVQKIGRFFASTQTCHFCHHKNQITLDVREFNCGGCGEKLDRDLNAAIMIKDEAYRIVAESTRTQGHVVREKTKHAAKSTATAESG